MVAELLFGRTMSNIYKDWSHKDFVREYAASIDRMMVPFEKTFTTCGGETKTVMVSGTHLDLSSEFFEAWKNA